MCDNDFTGSVIGAAIIGVVLLWAAPKVWTYLEPIIHAATVCL
jgi:hypothetical protein